MSSLNQVRGIRECLTGEARFVDDAFPPADLLEAVPVTAPHAAALVTRRRAERALEVKGIRAVLFAEDIPGLNSLDGEGGDEPLLAQDNVFFHGQIVALVVGETLEACREAAALVDIDYQPTPPVLTIEEALALSSFHTEPIVIECGDCDRMLAEAEFRVEGKIACGGQDHFAAETQVAWAEPLEGDAVRLRVSAQQPAQVQAVVGRVLGVGRNRIAVEARRVGGGFEGKETQAHTVSALAAVASRHTGAPVRVRFSREQDMRLTGKRHPFQASYEVGHDAEGRLEAVRISLFANGGWSRDVSHEIIERALLHLDNAYQIPHARFTGQACKTDLVSNTDCLGTGAAEAMLVCEEIVSRVARALERPAEAVRAVNLDATQTRTGTTPFGQPVDRAAIASLWDRLFAGAAVENRRREITEWNASHPWVKRGLAMVPVKLGAGSPDAHRNQAEALVAVEGDGTVQVSCGLPDWGQGLHARLVQSVVDVLGVSPAAVRVANVSAAAIGGNDAAASNLRELQARAVTDACEQIRERLRPVAAQLLREQGGRDGEAADIVFEGSRIRFPGEREIGIPFVQLAAACGEKRVSLAGTGFAKVPGLYFDRERRRGHPFQSFVIGAAVAEVEVDGFTGEHRVLEAAILQDDCGTPVPDLDRQLIERGFFMGLGWLTCEELLWHADGELWSDSAARYTIPTMSELPEAFDFEWWRAKDRETPLELADMEASGVPLALSIREAIRDAVHAFRPGKTPVDLPVPATVENVYRAITRRGTKPVDSVARIPIAKPAEAATVSPE